MIFNIFLLQVEDTISERRKLAVVLGQRSFVLLPRQLLSKLKENFTRKVFCIFGYKSSVNNHLKGTHCRGTVAEGTKLYFVLLSPKLRPAHERYLFEYNWSKTGSWGNHDKLQDALKTHRISLLQDFLQKRKHFCLGKCVLLSFRDLIR